MDLWVSTILYCMIMNGERPNCIVNIGSYFKTEAECKKTLINSREYRDGNFYVTEQFSDNGSCVRYNSKPESKITKKYKLVEVK